MDCSPVWFLYWPSLWHLTNVGGHSHSLYSFYVSWPISATTSLCICQEKIDTEKHHNMKSPVRSHAELGFCSLRRLQITCYWSSLHTCARVSGHSRWPPIRSRGRVLLSSIRWMLRWLDYLVEFPTLDIGRSNLGDRKGNCVWGFNEQACPAWTWKKKIDKK